MAVNKAAKKPIKESVRKVNREGQRWTDEPVGNHATHFFVADSAKV